MLRDGALAAPIDMLRNHGAAVSEEQRHGGPRPFLLPDFNLLGYNYRMTDLQGAVGLVQLAKLDRFISERQHGSRVQAMAVVRDALSQGRGQVSTEALEERTSLRRELSMSLGEAASAQAFNTTVSPQRDTSTRQRALMNPHACARSNGTLFAIESSRKG